MKILFNNLFLFMLLYVLVLGVGCMTTPQGIHGDDDDPYQVSVLTVPPPVEGNFFPEEAIAMSNSILEASASNHHKLFSVSEKGTDSPYELETRIDFIQFDTTVGLITLGKNNGLLSGVQGYAKRLRVRVTIMLVDGHSSPKRYVASASAEKRIGLARAVSITDLEKMVLGGWSAKTANEIRLDEGLRGAIDHALVMLAKRLQ